MIFDNTYCHPCFDFGTEKEATSRIVDIIERNPGKIVYIAMAALGKQRILLRLAKHFQTSIVVSEH